MTPDRSSQPHPELDRFVGLHSEAGDWPGAAYAVGSSSGPPRWLGAAGSLAVVPQKEPCRTDALYDLGSLTKPVTAAICLRLAARGRLDLLEPVGQLLPELADYAGSTPSLADLMAHRSGLPAWAPLYRISPGTDQIVATISRLTPKYQRGTELLYSDLGPILVGIGLERLAGESLRSLFQREVAVPLELEGEICFGPLDDRVRARTAPTEVGREREAQLSQEWGFERSKNDADTAPRRGLVHDGNAEFMGGAAGHAGLFGTAAGVYRFASAFAHRAEWLSPTWSAWGAKPLAATARDARTFGFQAGSSPSAPGGSFPARSFGHVGFPGTSIWIDAETGATAVLLSNRVHPRWREAPIQTWRSEFHRLAWEAIGEGA